MSSRKQCGRRFLSRNPETSLSTLPPSSGTRKEIDETWRGRHVRRIYAMCKPFILPTRPILGIRRGRYKHGGRRVAGIFEVNLAFYWFNIVHIYTVYGHYCCSVRCTFARSFNGHPNSWSLRTLICNTCNERSSKFPAEHLFLLLKWLTPFLSSLFLLYSFFG